MAVVVGDVEGADGFGDEILGGEEPRFKAGDADLAAGAARAGVGAEQRPVVFDAGIDEAEVVHEDLEVGEIGHEGLCSLSDGDMTDGGSAVVDGERAGGGEKGGHGGGIVAAPGGGVASGEIAEL